MGCSCEWKSIVGFLFHLIGDLFAVLIIAVAFAKPYSECLHIPGKHMHYYMYLASLTALLSSIIHLAVMNKCIGTADDAGEPEYATKQTSNKQYLSLTLIILLPNIGLLIYGAVVLFNARSPPPVHHTTGPGEYPANYCYSGLYWLLHLSIAVSALMILLAILICCIVSYQLRSKKVTAWSTSTLPRKRRPESSWNGNRSARYTNGNNNSTRQLIKMGPIDRFNRNEEVRSSAKWNTPRPQQMKPDYDPYQSYNS